MGLMEYKCPCCGGGIAFDSTLQALKCPYCDTEFSLETLQAYDDVLQSDLEDDMSWGTGSASALAGQEAEGLLTYTCNSCKAEIVCSDTQAATKCPYCDNPIVMTNQLQGMLKPDLIIPFQLDKQTAINSLKNHLQGKRLLPRVFQDENHIDEIQGLYVPFWLFQSDADAHIRYRGTTIRTWSDLRYNYTETSYYSVVRGGILSFDDIPADGSQKMPDELMESIEPYDISQAVPFQSAYLAGFLADKYDVPADDCVERVNARARITTEQVFASTVSGYASLTPEGSQIRLQNGRIRYALLPVWLLNTTWKGEKYTFAMNGQTGKFVGDLPMDKGILAKWFVGLTLGVGVLAAALRALLWFM